MSQEFLSGIRKPRVEDVESSSGKANKRLGSLTIDPRGWTGESVISQADIEAVVLSFDVARDASQFAGQFLLECLNIEVTWARQEGVPEGVRRRNLANLGSVVKLPF